MEFKFENSHNKLKEEKALVYAITDANSIENKTKSLDTDFDEFMSQHKKFFDYYAGNSNIEIKSHRELPISQQGTFAIDLKNDTVYAAMDVFQEKGYEDNASFFAMLHEFEHFRELRELTKYYDSKKNIHGSDIWEKHYKKLSGNRALGILDNCIDDIKMNRTVLDRAPSLAETKDNLYTTFCFPDDDLQTSPLHLQLAYALLRRRMLPDNKTIVDQRVEDAIARIEKNPINGMNIVDYMTRPEINMAERLMLQEALIEPEFLKLLEEAKQEQKLDKTKKETQPESGDSQEGDSQEGDSQEGDSQEGDSQEGDSQEGDSQEGDSQEGDSQEGDSQEGDSQEPTKQDDPKSSQAGQSDKSESGESKILNDPFVEYYREYEQRNPQATQLDAINEAFEKYAESTQKTEKPEVKQPEKTLEQRQVEALAERENVSVEDIKNYQRFWDDIKNLENPKTNESVVDELRQVFKNIITKRQPPRQTLRSGLDEGSEIDDYAQVLSGAMNHRIPEKIWTDFEKKEKLQQLVGNFDVSFVCDRSASMAHPDGEKAEQQRIAVGLFLEMFSEFAESVNNAQLSYENSLEIQTEVWGFGSESQVEIIKPMNEELSLQDRVNSYKTLSSCPGNSTLGYRPLQEIEKNIDFESIEKIRGKKYKKIVIVITDGVSSDPQELSSAIHNLHEKGVTVVAIGLGSEAEDIAQNYPNAILCPSPHSLGSVTADLLAHISKDL